MGLATRIINLRVQPTQPVIGQPAYIMGTLQANFLGIWYPLANQPINIYINGNYVGTAVTAGDGSFKYIYTFQNAGQYTITALYPGSSDYSQSSASIVVTVITPSQAAASNIVWLIAGLSAALLIGLIIGIYEVSR